VLRKLTPTKTRLLKPVKVRGADAFELFHDVLAQPVLRWRREFVAKAALERESRRLAAQRDESERIARRRLNLLVTSGAALALTIGLAVFSVFQWRQAKQALEDYKVEQTLRHAEEQRRQEAEAASKALALKQERTEAIESAVRQRGEALIAASSRQDYNAAIDGLTAALSIFEKYAEWSGIVHTKVERGKIYVLLDRLTAAQKDLDEAFEIASQKGNLAEQAFALESEASLHELQGAADTETLFRQAEDQYKLAGESLSVARIEEWRATRAEKARDFATAVYQYQHALERYRISGDMIGAERIQEALGRTVPWGFLADLNHGKVFPLRGDKIHVGRDSPRGAGNDVSFPTGSLSRRQLVVSRTSDGIEADDERSMNGTTVKAAHLPYGESMKLADGDVLEHRMVRLNRWGFLRE
jgi:tetratricopeptide (TPR) repeat protein